MLSQSFTEASHRKNENAWTSKLKILKEAIHSNTKQSNNFVRTTEVSTLQKFSFRIYADLRISLSIFQMYPSDMNKDYDMYQILVLLVKNVQY